MNNVSQEHPPKRGGFPLRFTAVILFTVIGFVLAILANVLIPQIASGVTLEDYTLASFTLNMNDAYRVVLAAIALIYLGIGIYSAFEKSRRKKFKKRAQFRFAMGIALALWDLLGTKLQVLPQPFFPGPAGIIKAFLMESDFIW